MKLFLLDAYALIYRAYYALIRSPRITSYGLNTSAIFGFCNTLEEVLRKENPTHIAVCFDPSGPTFRHEAFGEYKANRQKQPEDITLSIPFIKDILMARGIPCIEIDGYEADDVIGTLSHRAEKEGYMCYMMTPDKDFGQLVTDHVLVYKPSLRGQDFEIRDVERIKEKYGIENPRQLIDILALEGDNIDNIPGCPGVGPKTAQKLIAEFGNVENLLASTDKLKGALKKNIEQYAEQIVFSKFLATIKTDVPISFSIDSLRRKDENIADLRQIYEKLEFRTFLNRLVTKASEQDKSKVAENAITTQPSLFDESIVPVKYSSISDLSLTTMPVEYNRFQEVLKTLSSAKEIGLAVKSIGENAMNATLSAISIASGTNVWFLEAPAPFDTEAKDLLDDFLSDLFRLEHLNIVTDDCKRLRVLMCQRGIDFKCSFFDTSLASYLIDPESRHLLPELAHNVLNYITVDYQTEPRLRKPYDPWDPGRTFSVLTEAAYTLQRLRRPLEEKITDIGLEKLYHEVELPMAFVLADMEMTGVRIDIGDLRKLSDMYSTNLRELENEAFMIAGQKFNVGSPSQVGEILFGKLAIDPKAKKTKSGGWSTSEDNLEKYRGQFPIVDLILQIRGLKKLLTTYIDALPTMVDPTTGKIHTTFNQTVTSTGRISSSNPNLQNIPVRGELGKEIRRAFIPDSGCIVMAADYSQIELRLMADFSKDHNMIEAFRNNRDIHQDTASRIYHKPLDQVGADERRNAKTANFGILYGISAFGLSERLHIPRAEAKELIEGYLSAYPGVKQYIAGIKEKAREQGYVSTFTGRRRYLRELSSANATVRAYGERNAVNAPLQGSAADIIKTAMVSIHKEIQERGLKSRMIMQVHDELIFNVYPEEMAELQQLVEKNMSSAYGGDVPMTVAIGFGQNWLEAH